MRWQVMVALTNGWLWLLAVLATVVLVVSPAPLWFAVLSGAAVLMGGAAVQGAVEWRQEKERRLPGVSNRPEVSADPSVQDEEARAILARAESAAGRTRALRGDDPEAPPDVVANAEVATDGTVEALNDLGAQVDRLDRALAGIDPRRVQAELGRAEQNISRDRGASTELTEQRQRIADGLRQQLDAHRRLAEQRVLVLARMRAAAIELEGLAVRLGEIGALYSAQEDVTPVDADLRAVAVEMDDLRLGLVEAEKSLRQSLRTLD